MATASAPVRRAELLVAFVLIRKFIDTVSVVPTNDLSEVHIASLIKFKDGLVALLPRLEAEETVLKELLETMNAKRRAKKKKKKKQVLLADIDLTKIKELLSRVLGPAGHTSTDPDPFGIKALAHLLVPLKFSTRALIRLLPEEEVDDPAEEELAPVEAVPQAPKGKGKGKKAGLPKKDVKNIEMLLSFPHADDESTRAFHVAVNSYKEGLEMLHAGRLEECIKSTMQLSQVAAGLEARLTVAQLEHAPATTWLVSLCNELMSDAFHECSYTEQCEWWLKMAVTMAPVAEKQAGGRNHLVKLHFVRIVVKHYNASDDNPPAMWAITRDQLDHRVENHCRELLVDPRLDDDERQEVERMLGEITFKLAESYLEKCDYAKAKTYSTECVELRSDRSSYDDNPLEWIFSRAGPELLLLLCHVSTLNRSSTKEDVKKADRLMESLIALHEEGLPLAEPGSWGWEQLNAFFTSTRAEIETSLRRAKEAAGLSDVVELAHEEEDMPAAAAGASSAGKKKKKKKKKPKKKLQGEGPEDSGDEDSKTGSLSEALRTGKEVETDIVRSLKALELNDLVPLFKKRALRERTLEAYEDRLESSDLVSLQIQLSGDYSGAIKFLERASEDFMASLETIADTITQEDRQRVQALLARVSSQLENLQQLQRQAAGQN